VKQLAQWGFTLIDCQLHTEHLESLGARNIPRTEFLHLLKENRTKETIKGDWRLDLPMPLL
jgi:leucyl/phenylalanyl-tRNA--protein transferase